jgi:hypothetical protein
MTITLLSAHNSGSGTSWSIVLPAVIPNNSYAYMVLQTNSAVAGFVMPSGVAILDGAALGNGDGVGQSWLLKRAVGSADSSTTLSGGTFGGTGPRWGVTVVIGSGENFDGVTAYQSTNSLSATPGVPAITPIHADCLDLILGGIHSGTVGTPSTASPPAGFTEIQDWSTTVGTGQEVGGYAAWRQLTGQAGVAQAATALVGVSPTARAQLWRLTMAPGSGLDRTRDARLSGQVLSRALGKTRDARVSGQVLSRAVGKVRPARLSAQVLATNPPSTGFDGWGIPI